MNKKHKFQKGAVSIKMLAGLFAICLLSGLFLLLLSFRTIQAGTIGVVTRWGRVTERILNPGAHFVIPFSDGVMKYNTQKVTYETASEPKQKTSKADYKDYPVDTTTKDGQGVTVTYTIRFRIDPTMAGWLANNLGSEESMVEKVVKTDSRAWTRTIIRDFESNDLYSGNIREVQDKIYDKVNEKFTENGIILDEFVLREPRFATEYEDVMESKQRELEQVQVEKQIAEQEKYKKEARITAAEASAQEQRLQRETLTDALLRKQWIEAWQSGGAQVPNFISGDSGNMFFNIPFE